MSGKACLSVHCAARGLLTCRRRQAHSPALPSPGANSTPPCTLPPAPQISPNYDSLLAKVMVHAPTRAEAITRMRAALAATALKGVPTNLEFLQARSRERGLWGVNGWGGRVLMPSGI